MVETLSKLSNGNSVHFMHEFINGSRAPCTPTNNSCHVRLGRSFCTSGGDNGSVMMSAACVIGSQDHDRLNHEANQLVSIIERGSSVLIFKAKKRAERCLVLVQRETHQVIWSRTTALLRQAHKRALDIIQIKEVRVGKSSKELLRWPEEIKNCFTIYYGTEFKLLSASFAGKF